MKQSLTNFESIQQQKQIIYLFVDLKSFSVAKNISVTLKTKLTDYDSTAHLISEIKNCISSSSIELSKRKICSLFLTE